MHADRELLLNQTQSEDLAGGRSCRIENVISALKPRGFFAMESWQSAAIPIAERSEHDTRR